MLTYKEAAELLDYSPDTGELRWKKTAGPRGMVGTVAGTKLVNGRIHIKIKGKRYYAHRVAWLLHHGHWPEDQLDHKDHDPTNNRINNLREVDYKENLRNKIKYSNNSSGVVGVSWREEASKWVAYIQIDKKQKYLGHFDNLDEAVAARLNANKRYGYHENHGVRTCQRMS